MVERQAQGRLTTPVQLAKRIEGLDLPPNRECFGICRFKKGEEACMRDKSKKEVIIPDYVVECHIWHVIMG